MYTKGFGFTGEVVDNSLQARVIYNTGCISQSLTAIVLSLLEQAGKVDWNTKISYYLPGLQTLHGRYFDGQALLGDLLSHRTGLAAAPLAIVGKYNSMIARNDDIQQVFNNLPPVTEALSRWHHNEWAYALVCQIIDENSKNPWEFCVENIIGRLGLPRTYMDYLVDDKCARPCYILGDGKPVLLDSAYTDHRHGLRGSGSIRTCVDDMLNWCSLLIKASNPKQWDAKESPLAIFPVTSMRESTLTENRLLTAAWKIQQTEFVHDDPQLRRHPYGMGLYNFKLPTRLINTVSNQKSVVMKNYIMGANSFPRKVIGNTSDLGTYTSTYWVFPESGCAIVVLSNGNSANGDATNIIAQALTQALFNLQPQIDYGTVAALVSAEATAQWQTTYDEWMRHKRPEGKSQPLSAYAGDFTSPELQMTLSITTSEVTQRAKGDTGRILGDDIGRMQMCINNLNEQTFDLYHYSGDSWTFMPSSRDECLKQGYGPYIPNFRCFIIKFDPSDEGFIDCMRWYLDPDERVKWFTFDRVVVEEQVVPKRSSSVYSQPECMEEEQEGEEGVGGDQRCSSATSVDYAGAEDSRNVGRYSDFVQ